VRNGKSIEIVALKKIVLDVFRCIVCSSMLSSVLAIIEQSMGARNRVGIGLSYTGLPGYIGWRNRFLGIDSWAH
jgi:hypothetical protein